MVGAASGIGPLSPKAAVCIERSRLLGSRLESRPGRLLFTQAGGIAEALAFDIRDGATVDDAFEDVRVRHGRLDVAIATPGVNVRKPLLNYTDEDFDRVVGVNLKGSLHVLQSAGRIMAAQGAGSIILFSSIRSQVVEPGQGVYAATKAGINQMVRTLAAELGPRGVRVNAIARRSGNAADAADSNHPSGARPTPQRTCLGWADRKSGGWQFSGLRRGELCYRQRALWTGMDGRRWQFSRRACKLSKPAQHRPDIMVTPMKRRHFVPLLQRRFAFATLRARLAAVAGAEPNGNSKKPDFENLARQARRCSGPSRTWARLWLAVHSRRSHLRSWSRAAKRVFGLNRRDGKVVWTALTAGRLDQDMGPASRHAHAGSDRLPLAENGELACLRAGRLKIWRRNIYRIFAATTPRWLISESPLIHGKK